MILNGAKPELARSLLPHCISSTIYCTMNLRSIRHFLTLRTDKYAQPQIRELSNILLQQLKQKIDIIFNDIKGTNNIGE